jgi:hypothetical protein
MTFSAPTTIPETPPADLLAALDAAARALDELRSRAAELTLAMDEQARQLRIELIEDGVMHRLTPRQLFDLLG